MQTNEDIKKFAHNRVHLSIKNRINSCFVHVENWTDSPPKSSSKNGLENLMETKVTLLLPTIWKPNISMPYCLFNKYYIGLKI